MPGKRSVVAAVLAVTVSMTMSSPASAYERPGRTERVSFRWDGIETLQPPAYPSLSADGRLVSFDTAGALLPGDTNGARDVFVQDRSTGDVVQASTSATGVPGDGESYAGLISGNGRYVVFKTSATNLLENGAPSGIVVKDLRTGAVEAVDDTVSDDAPDGVSFPTDISADGRYVAFESAATNLVEGDTNGVSEVFLRDRVARTTERLSVDDAGGQVREPSWDASISDDARFVTYVSARTTPPADVVDIGDLHLIFARDRVAGTTTLVTQTPQGLMPNAWSSSPSISNDGAVVVFSSIASNLVAGDANRANDIFLRDLSAGITTRITVGHDGRQANGHSGTPVITGDGRYVSFMSEASNLDPDDIVQCEPTVPPKVVPKGTDRYSCQDIFVHDLVTGLTERVSVADDGFGASTHSHENAMSEDGRFVAFSTGATNLVPGDANGTGDVFVRDRGPAVGVGAAHAREAGGGIRVEGWATFSGSLLAGAQDDAADAGPGMGPLGAELTAATVAYRHEERSLMVRVQVASAPGAGPPNVPSSNTVCAVLTGCPPGAAEGPPFSYGVAFDHEGTTWRLLAMRTGTQYDDRRDEPSFMLHRCVPGGCFHAARLRGSWFVHGNEVRMVLPLVQIDGQPGEAITGVYAYAGVGDAVLGTHEIDSVELSDTAVPTARVDFAVLRGGEPVGVGSVAPSAGRFDHVVRPADLAGDRVVTARACLDAVCGAWVRAES